MCFPEYIWLNAGEFAHYQWHDNSHYSTFLAKIPGTYWVRVTDEFNCTNIDSIVVEDICMCPIYIPNSFTPDGDGINDLFRPVIELQYIETYSFAIMNRWGEIVFETDDPSTGWNGGSEATYVADGTYVWILFITARDGERLRSYSLSGMVSILR